MKLIMVHGRSQEGKDPAALKKDWLDALSYGLARANRTLPPMTTVEFPFFGDDLAQLVKATNTPLSGDVQAKGTATDNEQELRGEILMDIAASAGLTEADIAREFAGKPQEKGPQNWQWVQSILRAIDRVPGLNSQLIDSFTRDVFVYLTYPGVQAKIDGIVRSALGDDPCVLLAHSLGTIVSYNVLSKRAVLPPCVRFITVGSPLGIKGIKRCLDRPLRSPGCVQNWFNAYDSRDVVALRPLDGQNFAVDPPIENKGDVMNFTDNRHGIIGYLADPVVASKIVEYL